MDRKLFFRKKNHHTIINLSLCLQHDVKGKNSMAQFLHTMLRVSNLKRSIDFYTVQLGMTLLRTVDRPEQQYTLAYLGYGSGNPAQAELELTYNYGTDHYEMGNAYGHIAIGVENCTSLCETLRSNGVKITREAGPVMGGNTIIAFIEDPDGYKIELIENGTMQ